MTNKLSPDEVLKLLGTDAALLPVNKKKKPLAKGWRNTTFTQTRESDYLRSLDKSSAIAVLIGPQSQGLCSIDIDEDSHVEPFLKLNPELRTSLRTKGKRGCNVWVIIEGEYPSTIIHVTYQGKPFGEWRGGKGYTIISGAHKDGGQYQTLVNEEPVKIRYEDIQWLDELGTIPLLPPLTSSELSEESGLSGLSGYLSDKGKGALDLGHRVTQAEEARQKLKKNKGLNKLYTQYVDKKIIPKQGQRNSHVIAMATFLYHVVGRERLSELILTFWLINQDIYIDPLSEHLEQANSSFRAARERYMTGLNEEELKILRDLPKEFPRYEETFRICRDLARLQCEKAPFGEFFISYNDLGNRLKLDRNQAGRILKSFDALGIISVKEKGVPHKMITEDGARRLKKGPSTLYIWNIPNLTAKEEGK